MKNNILACFKAAGNNAEYYSRWYHRANKWASYHADKRGLRTTKVCAIAAALSPSVHWEVNKRDTLALLDDMHNQKLLLTIYHPFFALVIQALQNHLDHSNRFV